MLCRYCEKIANFLAWECVQESLSNDLDHNTKVSLVGAKRSTEESCVDTYIEEIEINPLSKKDRTKA